MSAHSSLQASSDVDWTAAAILTLILSLISVIFLAAMATILYLKRDLQPLKLKSPTLLVVFLIANIFTIALLCVIQMNVELC